MSVTLSVSAIRHRLRQIYPPGEASALTRILCCELMGMGQTDYYLGKDMLLSPEKASRLDDIMARLHRFEPIQYIQGFVTFLGRPFGVAPGVLIPRPETEELVEQVLPVLSPAARVLDIGTGSGCIAITLSAERPQARVCAWDVSPQALRIASDNNSRLGTSVTFRQVDVLHYQPAPDEQYDVIISNPPYITHSEQAEMEKNVLDWEPSTALFVPDEDPLLFYRVISRLGIRMLSPGGRLYFEINRAYGTEVAALLLGDGYINIGVGKDLSGNDRFVTAAKP